MLQPLSFHNEALEYLLEEHMLKGQHVEPGSTLLSDLYKDWSGDPCTHPVIAASAGEMIKKGDKEQAGIVSSAVINLSLYLDPLVNEYTSSSDFAIRDLVSLDDKVSLYLVVPVGDLLRLTPLLRMIFNLISTRLVGIMEYDEKGNSIGNKNRLLLMLDEFPQLGRLENLEKAFAFIAGYGLKAFIIVQSINQLKQAYGENNSIMDNCHVRIFFAPNDANTPEIIVKLLGTQTIEVVNKSWSGIRLLSQWSYSTNFQSRPLLTTGEISLLPKDKQIVLIAGFKPLLTNKNAYYSDSLFKARKEIPPVFISDNLTTKGE